MAKVELDLREKMNVKFQILNNQTFLDLAKAKTITFQQADERGLTSFTVNLADKASESDYNQLFEIQNVEFSSAGLISEVQVKPTLPIDNKNNSI